ncbi:MAG: alpha/beta fold hydrolase [Pseudomonadota bacterium]
MTDLDNSQLERAPDILHCQVGPVTLRTAHWPAPKGSPHLPLLFFNGIGANLELAIRLGDMFPDREIITFDVPGVGGSEVTRWPYRPWMLARWTRELLDQFGIGDVDVMGVSWGGAMAQQFAVQYRNRVGKLILCATTAGMTMIPGRPASLLKMADARRYTDPNYMRDNFATLYGDLADDSAGSHVANLMPPDPKGYIFQMLAFAGWSSLPFIRFLRMPALILMGEKDAIVPVANGHILNFGLPNSRLTVIPDAGHLFIVTKMEETRDIIIEFLEEPGFEAQAA